MSSNPAMGSCREVSLAMEESLRAELIQAIRIVYQNTPLHRWVRGEQRKQVHEIAVVGHVPGNVRMWPIRPPQKTIRRRFDERLRKRHSVRERRPGTGNPLRATNLHPALVVVPCKIEERL